jgi:hypothetical protein
MQWAGQQGFKVGLVIGAWDLGLGIWDLEFGSWNLGLGSFFMHHFIPLKV